MVNANFEAAPFGQDGTVTGWTVTGHAYDAAAGATSGARSAALSVGGDFQGDSIAQSFPTVAGTTYTVDFDGAIFGRRSGNPLQIQVQVIGATTLANTTVTPPEAGTFTPSAVTFQHYQITFQADNSGSATLKFISVGSGNSVADQVVDTVVVRPQ